MVGAAVSERRERRDSAIAEVSSKWGLRQQVVGPALVIPYVVRWMGPGTGGQVVARTATRYATFLPSRLQAVGTVQAESRSRGIFSVAVYRLALTLEGEFNRPAFADLGIDPATAQWDRAQLVIGISDVRAVSEQAAVTWNGAGVSMLPGARGLAGTASGIHAVTPLTADTDRYRFSLPLALNGSVGLAFTPFAENTTVDLTSNSPHPNFTGNWLPTDRSISAAGFHARWIIPFLGRNYPQAWLDGADHEKAIAGSSFGVELVDPVDHYRMAERSVKYAGLFILLTFASLWLIEILAAVRIHPIQYLLLGAALCLFYLLELTLSEHLGFPLAYAIASTAVVALVSGYGAAILGRARRAAVVGVGVTSLYGYLFVVLTNEDYALLIGAIGTFATLAGIMFLTRRVDWYRVGKQTAV